jgi:glycosyltransferase involved in cell wall biosynthesis
MLVSVIMINRNGGTFLREAVRSCRRDLEVVWQSAPSFEFLIVDNGSTDNSLQIIKEELDNVAFPCRIVQEPVAGVNYARNAGLRVARGQLLVFTDSDLQFEAGWLEAYLAAARDFLDCEAFAGRVLVGIVEGKVPAWLDLTGPYKRPSIIVQADFGGKARIMSITDEYGPVGPNMAFRRSIFERYGWFDTRFGLRPGSLVAGAEAEFINRLRRFGVSFAYVPRATVYHPVKRGQMTKKYFLTRLHGVGRVFARMRLLQGIRSRQCLGLTLYVMRQLLQAGLAYLLSFRQGCPKKRFYALGTLSILLGHLYEDFSSFWRANAEEPGMTPAAT